MNTKEAANNRVDPTVRIFGTGELHLTDNVRIDAYTIFVLNTDCWLGEGVHISSHCSIRSHKGIRIGKGSTVSAGCHLFGASDHPDGSVYSGAIEIGEGCLIGAGSVVLPDAIVRNNVMVGAGSLVKGELNADAIYGGRPAKFMRAR